MKEWKKGQMGREVVFYCLRCLTATLVWAVLVKSIALFMDRQIDLSDILIFAAAAFGGELLFLAFKRVFAKPNETIE